MFLSERVLSENIAYVNAKNAVKFIPSKKKKINKQNCFPFKIKNTEKHNLEF